MAGLTRTDLTILDKVHLAASAVALQSEYGAVSELARAFAVSRPTVYAARDEGSNLLKAHFGPRDETSVIAKVAVDERHLKRAAVALRVIGKNSVRAIEDLLPIVFPRTSTSYGKIHEWLVEAEQRAAQLNARVRLDAIEAGALDEMFSQGSPVLAGVDLDSGYLFALERRWSRAADDWADVLGKCKDQGLELSTTVQDAAGGIAAGVRSVFPKAEQRDDCFHAHYEMGKQLRRLELKAYAAIAKEEQARGAIEKLKLSSKATREERRSLDGKLAWAVRRCNQVLEQHDIFAAAAEKVREAMEVVDLEAGALRTPEQMEHMLVESASTMRAMDDEKCRKVGRYITNRAPGLVLYAASLRTQLEQLAEEHGDETVRLGCIVLRLAADLARSWHPWRRADDRRHLLAAYALLTVRVGSEGRDAVLRAVKVRLERRHRASSAIEGFNAALRPHLYVHKSVSQGFLDLFRAYYNLRRRRWGRHKGTSAYEVMTGARIDDWLDMLGYGTDVEAGASLSA